MPEISDRTRDMFSEELPWKGLNPQEERSRREAISENLVRAMKQLPPGAIERYAADAKLTDGALGRIFSGKSVRVSSIERLAQQMGMEDLALLWGEPDKIDAHCASLLAARTNSENQA